MKILYWDHLEGEEGETTVLCSYIKYLWVFADAHNVVVVTDGKFFFSVLCIIG